MAAKSLTLLLVLVLCLTPSHQTPPNKNITPYLKTFVESIVSHFRSQCLSGRTQFGVLILVPPGSTLGNIQFQPSDSNGNPLTNSRYGLSPSRRQYGNYLVARPNRGEHSETQLLSELHNLWNAYLNQHNGQLPEMIVLYSWIIPCQDCTARIRTHLAQPPYNELPIYVIYTTLYETEQNPRGNMSSLHQLGIDTFRECYWPPKPNRRPFTQIQDEGTCSGDKCRIADAFQYCVLDCAVSGLGGCVASQYKGVAMADFINKFMAACYNRLENIQVCALEWMDENLGPSCSSFGPGLENVKSSLKRYISYCNDKHFSKPIDVNNLKTYPGPLARPNELQYRTSPYFECSDNRLTSTLCSKWKETYITAGNSVCKNPCKATSSYSWCSVESPSYYSWGYCCTGSCGLHGGSYNWCYSKNKWVYCTPKNNGYSSKTYKAKDCHRSSLCGQHRYNTNAKYYWCYTDSNKNWDYCCRPDHPCGTHGYNYNWCYTSDSGKWQYCTP